MIIDDRFEIEDGILKKYYSTYSDSDKRIIVPNGITKIGCDAFHCITNAEYIYFPDGVEMIDNGACWGCHHLRSVRLPDTLKSIGDDAFAQCEELCDIAIPESLVEIGVDSFSNTAWLKQRENEEYIMANSHLLYLYNRSDTDVILPEGISEIGDSIFADNWMIRTFTACSTLRRIGRSAFDNCAFLTSVTFNDDIEFIGYRAFANCTALQTISLPSSLERIEHCTFRGCTSLKKVILNSGLRCIHTTAFYDCSSLREITIPEGVEYIGSFVFQNCTSLSRISLPKSIKDMGVLPFDNTPWYHYNKDEFLMVNRILISYHGKAEALIVPRSIFSLQSYAFSECGIKEVTLHGGIEVISSNAFTRCCFLEKVVLCEGIKEIANGAFHECSRLREIVLPASLQYIGTYAFADCAMLHHISLPNGISSIGCGAFTSSGLENISIPDSVEAICNNAFDGCNNLTNISLGSGLRKIGDSAFNECSRLGRIVIPENVEEIGDYAFSQCTSLYEVIILGKRTPEFCRSLVMQKCFSNTTQPHLKLYVEGAAPEWFGHQYYSKYAAFGYAYMALKGNADLSRNDDYCRYFRENINMYYSDYLAYPFVVEFLCGEKLITISLAYLMIDRSSDISVKAMLMQYLKESFTVEELEEYNNSKMESI